MATKQKTWKQLHDELGRQMRLWGVVVWNIDAQLQGKYATRIRQTPEERAVTLTFKTFRGDGFLKTVTLTMRKHDCSIDNMEALVKAVEHLRMADVRDITKLLVFAYRQLDPTQPAQMPPPPDIPKIPDHYRRLGVLPDAPLAVCEAAFKALARSAHPDAGSTTIDMQQLNAAIERIRKEKVR